MTLPKILAVVAIVLFATIGIAAAIKKMKSSAPASVPVTTTKVLSKSSVPLEIDIQSSTPSSPATKQASMPALIPLPPKPLKPVLPVSQSSSSALLPAKPDAKLPKIERALPHGDRIAEFFNKSDPKFPIVETITYRSRVAWQKGRPAWLSDYATFYSTSRHFIARSLNGKPDYFKQNVAEGDRFNVFRKDKNINFYLLVDTSLCRMWFYYVDVDTNQRVFIKDFTVGLGRDDSSRASGSLTPLGKYSLGNKIAIYKPKMMGMHHGQKVEMIRIFGSRWVPFDKEISDTSAPAKGFGFHGAPWRANEKGELEEDTSSVGKRMSDGCVRLSSKDMEELFAIIITKPTTVELVRSFDDAKLPGVEK